MRQKERSIARIDRRTFTKGTLATVVGLSVGAVGTAAAEQSAALVTGPDEEPIGSLSISEDDGSLTVTYTIDDEEYEITETHLHVAESADDIPTNGGGNPKVGHFDHASEHEEGAARVEHEVDVSALGDALVVAAQAKVRTEIEEEEEEEEEADEGGEEEETYEEEDAIEALIEKDEEAEEEETDEADEEEEAEEIEYEYEDAWADGERINDRTHPKHGHYLGSWATYVAYQRTLDE